MIMLKVELNCKQKVGWYSRFECKTAWNMGIFVNFQHVSVEKGRQKAFGNFTFPTKSGKVHESTTTNRLFVPI